MQAGINIIDAICNNSNGGASIQGPIGGTAPYTYLWSNGSTATSISGVIAGPYVVTITDANNCSIIKLAKIETSVPPNIVSAIPSCSGGLGVITVTATATPSNNVLQYSLDGVNYQANNVFTNLANNTYTVYVRDVQSQCVQSMAGVVVNCICPIPVANNSGPVCAGTAVQLSVNANLPAGVTATYTWNGPAGSSTQKNPIIPNITANKVGSYCVTVTYSNGCVASACTNVTLSLAATASISGASSFCAGGSATLTATGGGTYIWSNGSTSAVTTVTTAGTYTVTVTNASGCTKKATKAITVSAAPVISANIVCGANGGTVTISGNATSYTLNGVTQTNNVFTGIGNGTYIVTAANTAGCVGTTNVTVNCNVCLAEVGDITVNAVVCPGDPFVVTPDFNSPTVGYANYVIVANANGTIVEVAPATSGVAQTLSTSAAGTYYVYAYTVQVPNGGPNAPAVGSNVLAITGNCFDLSNSPYEVVLLETPLSLIGYQNIDEGDQGGITPFYYSTDTVVIEGGVPPYNIDWEIVGYVRYEITYTATGAQILIYYADDAQWNAIITDSYSCNNGTNLIFTNMQGSTGNTILDIDSYVVIPSSDYPSANGTVTLHISGGDQTSCAGGYTYEWAGPDTWNGVYGTSTGTPVVNGEQYVLTGLPMGWYSVTVTDCVGNVTEGWYWVQSGHRGRSKTETGIMMSIQPNPFNDVTSVQFGVATSGSATVVAYTIDGKQVATLFNGEVKAGQTYQVPFTGNSLAAGMYLIQIVTNKGEIRTEKVMIAH